MKNLDAQKTLLHSPDAIEDVMRISANLKTCARVVEVGAFDLAGQIESAMVVSLMSAAAELERLSEKLQRAARCPESS